MATTNKEYFTLREAFDRFGRLNFGKNWSGDEIAAERPYEPFVSTWHSANEIEQRYKETRLGLLECFWTSTDLTKPPVTPRGIDPSGKLHGLPDEIWKCETDEFVICLQENRVRFNRLEDTPTFRVRVPRPAFDRVLLGKYQANVGLDRPYSGKPKAYDWSELAGKIFDHYWSDTPPKSDSHCSKMLRDEMGEDDAPHDSQIRMRIVDMRRHGVID